MYAQSSQEKQTKQTITATYLAFRAVKSLLTNNVSTGIEAAYISPYPLLSFPSSGFFSFCFGGVPDVVFYVESILLGFS